jgi:hypothetical protein
MTSLTSSDAYREAVLSGRVQTQKGRILRFLLMQERPVSRAAVAQAFSLDYVARDAIGPQGWHTIGVSTVDGGPPIPLASVCGRVNVLVASGMVRELKGAGRGPMGDPVNLLEAVRPQPAQRGFVWPTM